MADNSEKPFQVYAAAAANIAIAVSKLIAAFTTGSSAMLSEAIHSIADTGNQLLMLLGLRRSRKPPDRKHPFGYGQEVYFWGFVVAMMLFSLGGGISMYEGIHRLQRPERISDPTWNYVVLGIAAVAEGISMYFGMKKFRQTSNPTEHWWVSLLRHKDPSVFLVVAEDAAGLAGIAVALAGIMLEQLLNSVVPDAIASLVIGGILAFVAIVMAIETHALLLGESADREIVSGVLEVIKSHPSVTDAALPLTMHFGPTEILVNVAVKFRGDLTTEDLFYAIEKLESTIRRKFPQVGRIFIEVESLKKPDHHLPAA